MGLHYKHNAGVVQDSQLHQRCKIRITDLGAQTELNGKYDSKSKMGMRYRKRTEITHDKFCECFKCKKIGPQSLKIQNQLKCSLVLRGIFQIYYHYKT